MEHTWNSVGTAQLVKIPRVTLIYLYLFQCSFFPLPSYRAAPCGHYRYRIQRTPAVSVGTRNIGTNDATDDDTVGFAFQPRGNSESNRLEPTPVIPFMEAFDVLTP